MFGRSVSIQESGVRGDRATKETTPLIGVTEEVGKGVAPLVGTNEDKFQVGPRRLHVATRAVLATLVFTQKRTPPRVPLVFPIVLKCEVWQCPLLVCEWTCTLQHPRAPTCTL
jgi:hypothetical protein